MISNDITKDMEKLLGEATNGKWSNILQMYKEKREFRAAKITPTEDTVLHMAVSSGENEVAEKMIDLLVREENDPTQNNVVVTVDGDNEQSWNVNVVLGVENEKKNTPLHFAAKMGNVEMCKKIGGIDRSLIAKPNIAGETPLFLAALYGKKEAFLWLHYLYMQSPGVSSTDFARCIRDNGDTILYCTIAEGHIDVAIEIVHLYKDHMKKMMERNKEGLSPLHLLAAQRSAFKSTQLLEIPRLVHPIYRHLKVEKKNQATTLEELQKKNQENFLVKYIKFIYWWLLRFPLRILLDPFFSENQENFLVKFINFIYWSFPLFPLRILLRILLKPFLSVRWLLKMKEKHTWTLQIMNELLQQASNEDMSQIISRTAPEHFSVSLQTEEDNGRRWIESQSGTITIETPLMIATKNSVPEMVKKILELFPTTIKDVNDKGKNIVLLAVEYRQTDVFVLLFEQQWLTESLFEQVDKEGNNVLHLAARLGVDADWLNPGEHSLSMLNEIKWFDFVKKSMPYGLLERYNKKMETPYDIFRQSHKQLIKNEGEWVAKASQAYSVVSTLVVSVAFATRTSVPGGYDANNGYAILRNKQPAFKIFQVSSFMGIFFSLISTVVFLSIVALPSQSVHSWRYLPFSLHGGVSYTVSAIVCLWISFCAADFFTLDDDNQKLNYTLPCYILSSLVLISIFVFHLPTFLGPTFSGILPFPDPKRKATRPIEYQRTKNNEKVTDLKHQN